MAQDGAERRADNSSVNGNKYPLLRGSSCLCRARIGSASSKILAAVSCRGRKLNERAWSAKVEQGGREKATGRTSFAKKHRPRENAKVNWKSPGEGSEGPVYLLPRFLSSLFEMSSHCSACSPYVMLVIISERREIQSFKLRFNSKFDGLVQSFSEFVM